MTTTTVTTDQWISADFDDQIRNLTSFARDMRQNSYLNLDFEAIWISLALISSMFDLSNRFIFIDQSSLHFQLLYLLLEEIVSFV